MVKCPSCGTRISFRKAIFGRLHKKGCSNCGARLRLRRTYGAIIGGIGGGVGAYLGFNLGKSHFSTTSIIILLAFFFFYVTCSYVFAKYEIIN